MNEKQHGRLWPATGIPVQRFYSLRAIGQALVLGQPGLHLRADLGQFGQHSCPVGRVQPLVVGCIELGRREPPPVWRHSILAPEALSVILRLSLSRAM